jgi:hypothetical protein
MARARATNAPVIAAVRVPPSAWSTSQSQVTQTPGMRSRSTAARRARPMRRWISVLRLSGPRFRRPGVEAGSIAYSPVTQPRVATPVARSTSHSGTLDDTLAVQSTRVAPCTMITLPSAAVGKGSILVGRSSWGLRPAWRGAGAGVMGPTL